MKKVIEILNKMKDDGIISGYAVGGAMGVMFYTDMFRLLGMTETPRN